jgi:hypothetical protein
MDLFRKKKEDLKIAVDPPAPVGDESAMAPTPKQGELDALVDSDEEGAECEIFDDEDDEEEEAITIASSQKSAPGSPKSLKEVMDNIGSHVKVPAVISQHLGGGSISAHTEDGESKTSVTGEDIEPSEYEETNSENKSVGSDSAEDYTDDEDEGSDGYKPGGYHPVKVGEVYNQR